MSTALVTALKANATKYRWVAATSGSQSAASLELATGGEPVMAIGGFSGLGGNLSLTQFEKYVKTGQIHYYVAGGGGAVAGGFGGAGRLGGPPSSSGGTGQPGIGALFGESGSGPGSTSGSGPAPEAGAGFAGAPAGRAGGHGSAGPGGRSSTTQSITSWVKAHYKAVTIGGQTVYDLTQPKS